MAVRAVLRRQDKKTTYLMGISTDRNDAPRPVDCDVDGVLGGSMTKSSQCPSFPEIDRI